MWDYVYRRPDALWGSLELTDAFFLLWYAIATFPWKNSGLYVNMSNNSNERLHQAGAWRASQIERANLDPDDPEDAASMRRRVFAASVASVDSRQPLDSERGTVSNRNVERTTADPQPPWVEWHSGNTLPRPNASTWGLHWPVTRILRRERKLVPVLPSNIVLGSPSESPDTLKLSVGVPTTGPRSVPKRFDEKGVEIAGSSFRSRPLGEASSSIRMLSRLGRSVSNLEQDPASDQAILSRGVLRRFGVSNRTSRTTSRTEGQTQGTCAGSTAPDLSGASSTNQSQVDYSQELPSVLSTNGSCDGILVQLDQGEGEREDHASD